VDFTAQPPDLRRSPLVAGVSRFLARSPRLAPPLVRFLFIGSRFHYPLLSAPTSRSDRSPGLSPCGSCGSPRPASRRTFTSYPRPCWAIGIGGSRVCLLLPCHTTGHAGPHPAVRKVEVTPQVSVLPFGRSSSWSAWYSAVLRSCATSSVSLPPPAAQPSHLLRDASSRGRWFSLASTA